MTADSFKKIGIMDIESYMPPKPPGEIGTSAEVDKIWQQFMQGEIPEVNEMANLMEIAAGLAKKAATDFYKLDEEYRPNVENYMFKLSIAMRQQMKKIQEQQIASQMASKIIMDNENKMIPNETPVQPPGMPGQGALSGVPGNQAVPPAGIG